MSKLAPAFRHPKRPCVWCEGPFTPVETLSSTTTEHFCSPECALARHQARALDILYPGAMEEARQRAVKARAGWSTEVAERLKAGREKAALQRISTQVEEESTQC